MDKPKRPLSVRIAQILLSILSVLLLVLLLFVAWWLASDFFSGVRSVQLSGAISISLWLAFTLLSAAGVLGMAQRRSWGRWMSIAALSVVFIFFVIFFVDLIVRPLVYSGFVGGLIGIVLINGALLWLILHLAFSRNIASFFAPTLPGASAEPPPPPTSFED